MIESFEWNRVKTVWLLTICCLEPIDNLRFCLFSTEYKSIVQFFLNQQKYQFYCQSCNKEVTTSSMNILLYKTHTEVFINTCLTNICEECFSFQKAPFINTPYCLFIEIFV